ncbi:hypothetical protein [Paractinoplanes atraurantiacus]|uniref:Uncharacterized protein n=1 Tax=Paractinoplanes atraurantiacus TaxID=1036182 RepID=A0A285GSC7_9ACTN|nr:hypothetical protein [Actinoplanes atraurantiacus]SNY26183.1 hypothetical protein SAMN05421748_102474 [Actinoplanes atraurantiacus]
MNDLLAVLIAKSLRGAGRVYWLLWQQRHWPANASANDEPRNPVRRNFSQ